VTFRALSLRQCWAVTLAVVILLGLAASVVVYRAFAAHQQAYQRLAESERLREVAYEIEINVAEAGLRVLKYLDSLEPQFRAGALEDLAELDGYLQRYTQLAFELHGSALDKDSVALFTAFEDLVRGLFRTADARQRSSADLVDAFRELNTVIGAPFFPASPRSQDGATERVVAARMLEASAAIVGERIGSYTRQATVVPRDLIGDSAEDFERRLETLGALPLSPAERRVLTTAESRWRIVRDRLASFATLTDTRDRDLAHFGTVREALDDLLDEHIQAGVSAALVADRHAVAMTQAGAMRWLGAAVLGSVLLTIALWVSLTTTLNGAVRQLVHGAAQFGDGELDYRIPRIGDADLDRVANGFNGMARQLKNSTVSVERLRESEEKLRTIILGLEEGYYEMDLVGTIRSCNPAFAHIVGHSMESLVGATHRRFTDEPTAAALRERLDNVRRTGRAAHGVEFEVEWPDGSRRVLAASIQLIRDQEGQPAGFRGLHVDITERKAVERSLQRQALHDALTGLPNRLLLHDRLTGAILSAEQDNGTCALLLIDLDHFKDVNDGAGHAVGDLLLQQVGPRLLTCLRKTDTLGRLGGDEFALVLRGADHSEAEQIADKILGALTVPFDLDGISVAVSASVGIAMAPLHAHTAAGLLRCADVAMYRAKRDRGGHETYTFEHDLHSVDGLSFVSDLRAAVQSGALELHYQPKIQLSDRTVVGVEALARWSHPSRGWIGPGEFIPALEKYGLIRAFTLWALETARKDAVVWSASGRTTAVAVNISPILLRDPKFFVDVLAIVSQGEGTGDWLELEVTESTLTDNPRAMLSRMTELRARGVRLTIDDFGKGYSSLTYLREFDADSLKIDRSFIAKLAVDWQDDAIVEAVIGLSHALSLRVVAEGVEDAATCDRLLALGCDEAQGRYFGGPLPAREIEEWLRSTVPARIERRA
jgi:diguanylate cyclase (GGDEF)-like protein/PAS domain S-box-containing protein